MNLLILGGTTFIGPHIVDAAMARGHTPTLFNRGKTAASRFPELEVLRGDRDPAVGAGLSALRGRRWDAVIDTCGYVPRIVAASAALLADTVGRYVFISSRSVYRDNGTPGIDENAAVATLEDPQTEDVTGQTYGALKAACERAAETAMPGRVASLRAGVIVGPGDPTDRFTYWPRRIDRGGEVLAPGDPQSPVQFIDVRDLAEFVIQVIEGGHAGPFNVLGPQRETSMAQLLDACKSATSSSDARFTWVSQAFLAEQAVQPWTELPLWVPDTPDYHGFSRLSNARAIAAGLRFRPLADTARDTLSWSKSERPDTPLRAGLTADRERAVLDAWHRRSPAPEPNDQQASAAG